MEQPSTSLPPTRHAHLHSSLPRRSSTSSLHVPSSTSFLRHGPSPPPQRLLLPTSQLHSSGCSTWRRTGVGPSVQSLVLSDRRQTLVRGQNADIVPPPSCSFSSLPRPRVCSSSAPPPRHQSVYATLTRHSEVSRSGHCPPQQPRRLDVPPEGDWRRDAAYRTVKPRPSCDHHRPLPLCPPPHPRRRADIQLCSLCRQLPAELPRPLCSTCSADMAQLRPLS